MVAETLHQRIDYWTDLYVKSVETGDCRTFGRWLIEEHLEPVRAEKMVHATKALADFMSELGEIMSIEDGTPPSGYLKRAREILEWCHDHQGPSFQAFHASAPNGHKCADCTIADHRKRV